MGTSPQCMHKLKLLSDAECWSIINERISGKSGASIPLDLVDTGKEIAEKCRGLPLAARVLGGTMRGDIGKEAWLTVKDSDILNVSEREVSIESVLRLSFDRLPSHLKPCFAYCSMFHKSLRIGRQELINLWMAQGLLKSPMEETGDKYFKQLLLSSFLQDGICDEFGDVISVRLHDLVHDLALSISKFETLTWETEGRPAGNAQIKHLNIIPYGTQGGPAPGFHKKESKRLRSLFTANAKVFYDSWKFESLRILKLRGSNVKELPASVGKMIHLRFLDVSWSEITMLPDSLTKLYNLQTLMLVGCKLLEKIPTLRNLASLRHIMFSYEKQMPSEVSSLNNLRTLPLFVVGPERGGNIQELEYLNELSGELEIYNLEHVRDVEEAKKANLQSKSKIDELLFVWTASDQRDVFNFNDEEVLEGLQPFKDLKALRIKNYMGEKFPSWLLEMKITRYDGDCSTLNSLVELKMEGCRMCGEIPRLGHLPHLKYLEIVGLYNVRCLGDQFYGSNGESTSHGWKLFPALKRFSLGDMNRLLEWMAPTTWNVFPCLEELQVSKCPMLRSIPITHLSSLVKLRIHKCDEFSELLFDEDHTLTSLDVLEIEGCGNLVTIGCVQGLTSLRRFEIGGCLKLMSLPEGLSICSSLKFLAIWACGKLTYLPEDLKELHSLNELVLIYCPSVSNFTGEIFRSLTQLTDLSLGSYYECWNSIQDLPSLTHLTVSGQDDFKSLPYQIQSLTALQSLSIFYFDEVEVLPEWLGNLSSLQFLGINSCKNLKHLPSATALQGLPQLRELIIDNCPLLKESCTKGSGSEWSKISHIPLIMVDEVTL